MTFKELVEKYRFDDFLPELSEIWDEGNLYCFRQAFDILRQLEPTDDGRGLVIRVNKVKTDTETYDRVDNLSGWGWDECLSREIVVDEECDLSEKQLLALCLWERTFYGFSPEQEHDTFRRWDEEAENDAPELDEMDKRRELISDICAKYPSLCAGDLDFLLCDRELSMPSFMGVRPGVDDAIEYVIGSITGYSDLPRADKDVSSCVALLRIPANCTIADIQKERLSEAIQSTIGVAAPDFHSRINADDKHLSLTLIYVC